MRDAEKERDDARLPGEHYGCFVRERRACDFSNFGSVMLLFLTFSNFNFAENYIYIYILYIYIYIYIEGRVLV